MRLATTSSLVSRRDVIVVASVSCIYGLGSPEDYKAMMVGVDGGRRARSRHDAGEAGRHSVRAERHRPVARQVSRAGRFGRDLAELRRVRLSDGVLGRRNRAAVDHQSDVRRDDRQAGDRCTFIRPSTSCCRRSGFTSAVDEIRKELRERLELFKSQGKLLEAQRLSARTRYDVEMMMEMGYCPGIENYSRPLERPKAGRAAVHAVRFLPGGLFAVRRRVARDGAAGRGDVRRRPQPQGDAGGARLPAAERAGQSAAEVRRVEAAGEAGGVCVGDAGQV